MGNYFELPNTLRGFEIHDVLFLDIVSMQIQIALTYEISCQRFYHNHQENQLVINSVGVLD